MRGVLSTWRGVSDGGTRRPSAAFKHTLSVIVLFVTVVVFLLLSYRGALAPITPTGISLHALPRFDIFLPAKCGCAQSRTSATLLRVASCVWLPLCSAVVSAHHRRRVRSSEIRV